MWKTLRKEINAKLQHEAWKVAVLHLAHRDSTGIRSVRSRKVHNAFQRNAEIYVVYMSLDGSYDIECTSTTQGSRS
jgi:hypothetical protein